eukprot:3169724-Rhodomonas_salina.1
MPRASLSRCRCRAHTRTTNAQCKGLLQAIRSGVAYGVQIRVDSTDTPRQLTDPVAQPLLRVAGQQLRDEVARLVAAYALLVPDIAWGMPRAIAQNA